MGSRITKNDHYKRATTVLKTAQQRTKTAYLLCLLLITFFSEQTATYAQQQDIVTYRAAYIHDLYSIIKSDTNYIKFFPNKESYKVVATVQVLKNEPVFKLNTSSGKTKEAQKYAAITFWLNGSQYRLYAYQLLALKQKETTANDLFLPFTDLTNSVSSYGGGRYIDLNTDDIKEGEVTIDFNKAYNPYCAFTTGYNCPIPPKENFLNTLIEAGESYDADYFQKDK